MLHVDPTHLADSAAHARALIEGQQALLTRLAQVGMEIVEVLGREAAAAEAAGQSAAPAGVAFARVARAVRMTIALQSRLMKDLAALDRDEDMAERTHKTARRMRLNRLTTQAAADRIEADIDAGRRFSGQDAIEAEIEQLSDTVFERLTDAEDGFDLDGPFDEAVARICADLGLSTAWTARLRATVQAPAADDAGRSSTANPVGAQIRTRDPAAAWRTEEPPIMAERAHPP